MQFDPALAAQHAFKCAVSSAELGDDLDAALEAEETFSASAGDEAKAAYARLQELGDRYPGARSFQEFLIYITWQQVTEETIPRHFRKGLELCDGYLAAWDDKEESRVNPVRELRESFRAGLGLDADDEDHDYDRDVFKGGD